MRLLRVSVPVILALLACKRAESEDAAETSAPAAQPAQPATPAATPAAQPATASQAPTAKFLSVPASEWTPILGPKMALGSKVAHEVFRGSFGPSASNLFAIIKKQEQFHALVLGEDNKAWPAGPLHDDTWFADKVLAVSFFDANQDGQDDALVMMTIKDAAGTKGSFNALLKWTNLGMRRMLDLEDKIQGIAAASSIRQKLTR